MRFLRLFGATYALLHRRQPPIDVQLTPEGRGLMLHLAWSGPLTIGDLALHTDRAQSVISESVSVLESHGMLARVRDPRDRRRTLVWLTDRAHEWLREEQEPIDRTRTAAVLAAMPVADQQQLIEAFEKFIETAQRLRAVDATSTAPPTPERRPNSPKGK